MSLRKHQFVKIEKTEFVAENLKKAVNEFQECIDQLDTLMVLNVDAQLAVDNSWENAKQLLQTSAKLDSVVVFEQKKVPEVKKQVQKPVPKSKSKKVAPKVQEKPKIIARPKKKTQEINYAALKKLKQNLDSLQKNM